LAPSPATGRTLIRSIWVFLARGRFAAKAPFGTSWILLDFLGFSRPNRDFSMGYARFGGKNFSPSFSAGVGAPERAPAVLAWGCAGLFIGASLIQFLISCNELSSGLFPFGRLNPKNSTL
jgi:hypothetical protein